MNGKGSKDALQRGVRNGHTFKWRHSELNTLTLVESIIKQTIEIDMSMGMHYKEIYKDCKERFGEITYLIA